MKIVFIIIGMILFGHFLESNNVKINLPNIVEGTLITWAYVLSGFFSNK